MAPQNLEKMLVMVMGREKCSLVAALEIVFDCYCVNGDDVYDVVEFLECGLPDLDTVSHFMKIWTGEESDLVLKMRAKNEKLRGI